MVGNHYDIPNTTEDRHQYSLIPEEHHMAAFFTKEALEYLADHRGGSRPFCMVLSYFGPHLPVAPPRPWDEKYTLDQIDLPPNHDDRLENKPEALKNNDRCYLLPEWTEESLREELSAERGIVLIGPPLDGKTRTLFETIRGMKGWWVLRLHKDRAAPWAQTVALDGKKVIVLLDDLPDYSGRPCSAPNFISHVSVTALDCVVAATCPDRTALDRFRQGGDTELARLFEELPLKLTLLPPSDEDRRRLAEHVGTERARSETAPALGSIPMADSLAEMAERFRSLAGKPLDVLHALRLLAAAGVTPFTHERLAAVLRGTNLADALDVLGKNHFVKAPFRQDPVEPDRLYLELGTPPEDDLPNLEKALVESGDASGLLGLGVAHQTSSPPRREEARRCFEESVRFDPENPEAHHKLGHVLGDLGRHEEALASYEEVLRQQPDYLEAHYNKAVTLNQLGRSEEALAAYEKALRPWGSFPAAQVNKGVVLDELGRPKEALAAYDKALRQEPEVPDVHFNKGVVLGNLGRPEEELASYEEALRLRPEFPEALNNRSAALVGLGRFEEALASCDEALRLKSEFPGAHSNRAMVLSRMERHEEALASCEEALRQQPEFREALINRSNALAGLERFEEALASCEEALRLEPKSPEAHATRAMVLTRLGRPEEALASFAEALRLRPEFPEAHCNKALALEQLGRLEDALASYQEALRQRPDDPDTHLSTGVLLGNLGRPQQELAEYEEALRQQPQFPLALSNKSDVLVRLGRPEEALASCEEALRQRPEYPEALLNRGLALVRLGRLDDAFVSLCQAWQYREQLDQETVEEALQLFAEAERTPEECPIATSSRPKTLP